MQRFKVVIGLNPAKNAIRVRNPEHDLSKRKGVILAHFLKPLEEEFSARGMLPRIPDNLFYPLWFSAEQERNNWLWRQGASLIEADDFDFCINLPALVKKRLERLSDPQNPFLNPNWGSDYSASELSSVVLQKEEEYLRELEALIDSLDVHLKALGEVGRVISESDFGSFRPLVVLPG